ncbi:MAG: branched-chain-amino-acid transaminase [Verrucomicrobiae bacterium]|nr:branched-chain-amino-acid transaminase [Verrucomicrobiae bacterium]
MQIYIDGQYFDEADAKVSVFDHGLLYGDGVFEGIRVYSGRIFKLDEHLERLYDSAKAILLKVPLSFDELKAATIEACRRNKLKDGYIRMLVTRGKGSLGLSPDSCPRATVIIIAAEIELYPREYYTKGLRVATAPTRRTAPAALSPSVKSLNYLNNVMGKIEGKLCGAQEVIMLNEQGYVAEGSGDNVFVLKKGTLFTPPIFAGALGGITRRVAMDLAAGMGIPVSEVTLMRYDLFVADEVFLTGTGAEIIPAVEIDGRPIGDGTPGPITRRMMEAYAKLTRGEGTPIF